MWLNDSIPDSDVAIDGFNLIWSDRTEKSEKWGRGVHVHMYINNSWCTDFKVHEEVCTPHVERLSVSIRLFYLPREFTKVIVCCVYVPLSASVNTAAALISRSVSCLKNSYPDAAVFVLGDFNSCQLDSVMPSFQQFVTCHTRRQRTIDLCYGNVKDADTSLPRPPLGRADHNVIHLLPKFCQLLKRVKPRLVTVRCWTDDAVESLRGCFDCTDWDLLSDPLAPLDTRIDVVTDYMKFCLDNVIPHAVRKVYSNSKPWFTSYIHSLLKEKCHAFREKNLSKFD